MGGEWEANTTAFCAIKGKSSHVLTPYSTLKAMGRSPVFSQAAICVMCRLQEQAPLWLNLKDGMEAAYVGLSSQAGGLVTSTQGKA